MYAFIRKRVWKAIDSLRNFILYLFCFLYTKTTNQSENSIRSFACALLLLVLSLFSLDSLEFKLLLFLRSARLKVFSSWFSWLFLLIFWFDRRSWISYLNGTRLGSGRSVHFRDWWFLIFRNSAISNSMISFFPQTINQLIDSLGCTWFERLFYWLDFVLLSLSNFLHFLLSSLGNIFLGDWSSLSDHLGVFLSSSFGLSNGSSNLLLNDFGFVLSFHSTEFFLVAF